MTRLLTALAAGALSLQLWLTASDRPVIAVAVLGLVLTAVALAASWRWAATAAAVVFLAGYALALRTASRPAEVVPALWFGLALLLLLGGADLAGRARGATVRGRVVGATVARWVVLGAGAGVAATLALTLATVLATALPSAVSPLLAGGGALAGIWILAALVRHAADRSSGSAVRSADRPPRRPGTPARRATSGARPPAAPRTSRSRPR